MGLQAGKRGIEPAEDFFQSLGLDLIALLVQGRQGRGIRAEVEEIISFITRTGSALGDEEGYERLRRKFSASGEILIGIYQIR